MELLGQGFYWDELSVGNAFRTLGRTITNSEIVNFISCVGMLEALFVNSEFRGARSVIRGRPAPAALVYSISEGLVLNAMAQDTGLAFLNTEINVLGPVVEDDTVHVELEVIEMRPSKKSDQGLVRTRNHVLNQNDVAVMEYNPLRLIARK